MRRWRLLHECVSSEQPVDCDWTSSDYQASQMASPHQRALQLLATYLAYLVTGQPEEATILNHIANTPAPFQIAILIS